MRAWFRHLPAAAIVALALPAQAQSPLEQKIA
jgi:hypothetical protein